VARYAKCSTTILREVPVYSFHKVDAPAEGNGRLREKEMFQAAKVAHRFVTTFSLLYYLTPTLHADV
jgi:hypothetical protein